MKKRLRLVDVFFNGDYGNIGKQTNYKDINGKNVCVGDIVKVVVDMYGNKIMIIEPMVKNEVDSTEKAFILGIESNCNDVTGEIDGVISDIEILVPYTELKEGMCIGGNSELLVESFENEEEK